jgi:hypothetical protein
MVKVKDKELRPPVTDCSVSKPNRKLMKVHSNILLEGLVNARDTREVWEAFQRRAIEGIKREKIKPKKFGKYIDKLSSKIKEWTPEETREILNKLADDFCKKSILQIDHR